jgi:hypothetical protein
LDARKGAGHIAVAGAEDLYFTIGGLVGADYVRRGVPRVGQLVTFDVELHERGPRVVRVCRLSLARRLRFLLTGVRDAPRPIATDAT